MTKATPPKDYVVEEDRILEFDPWGNPESTSSLGDKFAYGLMVVAMIAIAVTLYSWVLV